MRQSEFVHTVKPKYHMERAVSVVGEMKIGLCSKMVNDENC